MNECETADPCSNGGTCLNIYGGYICNCLRGYTGEQCKEGLIIYFLFNVYIYNGIN